MLALAAEQLISMLLGPYNTNGASISMCTAQILAGPRHPGPLTVTQYTVAGALYVCDEVLVMGAPQLPIKTHDIDQLVFDEHPFASSSVFLKARLLTRPICSIEQVVFRSDDGSA